MKNKMIKIKDYLINIEKVNYIEFDELDFISGKMFVANIKFGETNNLIIKRITKEEKQKLLKELKIK